MTYVRLSVSGWVCALAACLAAGAVPAQQAPARIVSPEIQANGDVTFRLRAPNAAAAAVTSGGDIPGVPFGGGLAMEPNAEGVWEVTLPAVDGGAYRYRYDVDGVSTLDPGNPAVSESNNQPWSLFHVEGAAFMDTAEVPHGAVSEVTYYSETLGRHRRMHVYTPPGYGRGEDTYPVLYLLHGAGDSDDSWSTVGRAGFILDNLIASGGATPMVVVMPHGHTGPSGRGGADGPANAFVEEFAADIKPHVEANYRVRTDRADTAVAGLSMGGAQALDVSMTDLDEYAYIGVFSSGIFSVDQDDSWRERHRTTLDDASLREGLEWIWFATGRDDFLLDTTEASVELLRGHGFDVTYRETDGGHTWINWRRYLNTFAAELFRGDPTAEP